MAALWYRFVRGFVRIFFFQIQGGFRVEGVENFPATGPVLVVPIHMSHLDPPAVACAAPRILRFMAKKELFHHRWFGGLIRSLGAFPVHRGEVDKETLTIALQILNSGEPLLMFPEGTRNDGARMLPLTSGAALLAKKTGAAVVPFGLIGTSDRMPKGSTKVRRGKVIVRIGKPFTYGELAVHENERENRAHFTAYLAEQIRTLSSTPEREILPPLAKEAAASS